MASSEIDSANNISIDYDHVKIITWNIDHYPNDLSKRLEVIGIVLLRAKPDILLLQECSLSTAQYIAGRLNMTLHSVSEHGEAVLSSLEPVHVGHSYLGSDKSAGYAYAHLSNGCHEYLVISTHFSWGGGREVYRVNNALELDAFVNKYFSNNDNGKLIGVIGGDLNAEPDSDSVRYLRGEAVINGSSTLYSDVWRVGSGPGYTSTKDNPYAFRTAKNVGLEPSDKLSLPDRRIDYLLVRGYAYCRVGAPLSSEIIGDGNFIGSDHFGIAAELFC